MLMDDPSLNSGGGTPDSGGPSANPTPITLSTLLDIADTATTGVASSSLAGKQGWFRRLDTGEKVTNSPTVFFNRLRFGTYAPGAQLNSCTPPGGGRLNEINSLTGDLFTLNTGAMNQTQRYYSTVLTRGYISTGQLVVIGKSVYHIVVSDTRLQSVLVGTIGASTKVYWYMEPEQ